MSSAAEEEKLLGGACDSDMRKCEWVGSEIDDVSEVWRWLRGRQFEILAGGFARE